MNKDDLPPRTTPYYSKYQRDIFIKGAETGELPTFSTDPDLLEALPCPRWVWLSPGRRMLTRACAFCDDLQAKASETLTAGGKYYAVSNAGSSWTHYANREAFYRHRIVPRMLVDTNQRDMSCTLKLGTKTFTFDAPIGFAPIGINKIYHPLGELNSAHVARDLRLPYCLSTAGSQSIPDVAEANGDGTRFFQLYWPHDEELTISILKQAISSGFQACFLTLDTWQLAWRHGDVANANYAFYRGIGYELGKGNEVFQRRCKERGIELESPEAGQFWIDNVWCVARSLASPLFPDHPSDPTGIRRHGKAWSWEKLPWLIKTWKELSNGAPFVLKGIQSVADAKKAASIDGIDGIVVSNHAGRQVDGAVASLDALDEIVKSGVGEKLTVMFDSLLRVFFRALPGEEEGGCRLTDEIALELDRGVRGAADVAKALCLGAKMVFVGRLWVYGMGIAGEYGVRHVMKSLLADFDILFQSLKDFTRDALVHVPNANLPPAKL
ncbi:SPOSA6832_02456, partial [Sporobolomyces salmonicolor]